MLKKSLKQLKLNNMGYSHDENQYLNLINDIINEGTIITGRNGNVRTVIGSAMHFDLTNNTIPLLTTKKLAYKTCLKELLWFISGSTDNKILQENGVKNLNENGSREFLDSRGLSNLEENDLGPVYGHQWRFFNAKYNTCNDNYEGEGKDQLQSIINSLLSDTDKYSRRLVMSAWNPCQIDEMALPPCHVLCQFNVIGDKLSCDLYQRSGDVGLGVPFNIASYSYLTHLIAHHCNLEASDFNYHLSNAHIYEEHIESLKTQLSNEPYQFAKIKILNKYDNINNYKFEDFEIENYNSHNIIKMQMKK